MKSQKKITLLVILFVIAATIHAKDLDQVKQEAFTRSNVALLNTLSGTPYLHIHYPFKGINYRIKFDKQILKNLDQLYNFGVIEKVLLGYGSHTKDPGKLEGSRHFVFEKIVKTLQTLHLMKKIQLKEDPLVELYLNHVPMMWILKNATEVEIFFYKLTKRLQELNIAPTEKSILILNIEESKPLSLELKENMEQFFYIFTPEENQEITNFIQKKMHKLREENYELEGSNPERPYEAIVERMVNDLEKFCKELKLKKIVPALASTLAAVIIIDTLWKNFLKGSLANISQKGFYAGYTCSEFISKGFQRHSFGARGR